MPEVRTSLCRSKNISPNTCSWMLKVGVFVLEDSLALCCYQGLGLFYRLLNENNTRLYTSRKV